MKRCVFAAVAAVLAIGLFTQDADAARLGGGRSVGMSRSSTAVRPATPPTAPSQSALPAQRPQPAATPQTPAPQPSGMSRWLGPLAGIAAGVGLAALFSHFGLGGEMADMAMILLLVLAAVFFLRAIFGRRQAPAGMQYAGMPDAARFEPASPATGGATPSALAASIPAGFDSEGFLRQAKLNFVRLQAANDAGNMADLKEFTTPEVFAEAQMQYEERGRAKQQTDVVQLNAELLDVTSEEKRHIASVRFSGQLRESPEAAPASFDEVWHLVKPVDGSEGWRVAGIQQVQ